MNTVLPLPALGVDMLTDELGLSSGAVRSAVNVDIDKGGAFRRRAGYTLSGPGAGYHSIFSRGALALVGRESQLLRLDSESLSLTDFCEMGNGSPIDFSVYNDSLYICNRGSIWRVAPGEQSPRPVGVRMPSTRPAAVPHGTGTLTAGRYAVAISLVDDLGEESAAVMLGSLDLTAGLRLTAMPLVPDHRWRVYITPPDGDTLFLAEEFDAGVFADYTVTVYPNGAPCMTLHLAPMPAGDFVRGYAGRTFVARDNALYFSEALRPHLHAPRHNFISFVGRLRLLEFVRGGVFVGDDRGVWWLAGDDPSKYEQVRVSDALAVHRSGLVMSTSYLPENLRSEESECAIWLSTHGYMVGMPGGSVRAMHPDRIRLDPALSGRSVLTTRDGTKQLITLTAAAGTAPSFGGAIDTLVQ